jgi:hypothetical protein
VKKSKIVYQFFRPKDKSVGATTGAASFSHTRTTLIMRLWFWLQLQPLSFGLYSEKITVKVLYNFFLQCYRPKDRGVRVPNRSRIISCWDRANMMRLRLRHLSFGLYSEKIKDFISSFIKTTKGQGSSFSLDPDPGFRFQIRTQICAPLLTMQCKVEMHGGKNFSQANR